MTHLNMFRSAAAGCLIASMLITGCGGTSPRGADSVLNLAPPHAVPTSSAFTSAAPSKGSPTPTPAPSPTAVPTRTATPSATPTVRSTPTPIPSPLPTHTATPAPTNTTPAPGPYHIDTWVYDSYWGQGENASSAAVEQLASYAQGNQKAILDCPTITKTCKSVFYLNPNHEYAPISQTCINHPDADVLAVASETWFIHDPGYSDSNHRVYGKSAQSCTIWEMDPASVPLQNWWLTYLRTNADSYSIYLLDNDPMDVADSAYFPSGGGCLPWPSICKSTNEIATNTAEVAARAAFANAMTHANGDPMYFFYQQASFDDALDTSVFGLSPHIVGVSCEGCIATYASPVRPNLYAKVLNEMAAVINAGAAYLLISHGNSPIGSTTQLVQREVTTAILWLAYSEGQTIVQPDLESNTDNLAVWPEDLIYPSEPIQSMASGAADLQVAPGVFRREFRSCYFRGSYFGQCAAIVNANTTSLVVSVAWLQQQYRHEVTLSGGDVLSGGIVNLSGASFQAGTSTVPAGGAILLTP